MATAIPALKLQLPKENEKEIRRLCIKLVPESVKTEELKKILEQYGKVLKVKDLQQGLNTGIKFPYRFADCPDKYEMWSIINGMKNDKSGYIVEEKINPNGSNTSTELIECDKKSDSSNRKLMNKNGNSLQQNKGKNTAISDQFLKHRFNQKKQPIAELKEKTNTSERNHQTNVNNLPQHNIESVDDFKMYNCSLCGKMATMCCERCQEIYCSLTCQNKDWKEHRYVCFKKPRLIDISKAGFRTENHIAGNDDYNRATKTNQSEAPINKNNLSNHTNKICNNISTQMMEQQKNNDDIGSKRLVTSLITTDKIKLNKNQNSICNKGADEIEKRKIEESKQYVLKSVEKAPLPKSGEQVVITHFEQLNNIYIRSNEKQQGDKYVETVNFVIESAKTSKYLISMPKPKDMVICQFEGYWYRALVLNPQDEDNILIAYIDFGNAEIKKLSELKEMHADCFNFKRYPICVSLKEIPSIPRENITPECKAYLQYLIDNLVQLRVKYTEGEKDSHFQIVELFENQTNKCVNEKIRSLLNEKPKAGLKSTFLKDLKVVKFSPGENKNIIILDNSFIEAGFLTCVLNENIDEIEKSVEIFTEHASKDPNPYEPLESELCLVKVRDNPEKWYRASCETVSENGRLELLLVDFGSVCEESVSNVRKYPIDLNIPLFSSQCFIEDLMEIIEENPLDNETKSKLMDLLPNFSYLEVPKIQFIKDEVYINLPVQIIKDIREKIICNTNN